MTKLKKSALAKATDLLAAQEQSSNVLRRKLLARKYDAAVIAMALAFAHAYIDDDIRQQAKAQLCRFFGDDILDNLN